MALAASLAELQAEASCPVCLDQLQDPVTLDCGHNCCGPCLHRRWEDLQDILPCPVCQHPCPSREVKRNTQLCALTALLRRLPPARGQGQRQEEGALCAQHHQALALFCEEDLELLCAQCAASSSHHGHPLAPIEHAAARHRKELRSCLEPLKQQLEEARQSLAAQVSVMLDLSDKEEQRRREAQQEVEAIKHSLRKERDALEDRLLRGVARGYRRILKGRGQLLEHSSALQRLLGVVTRKSLQTDRGLLAGIGGVHLQCSRLVAPTAPAAPAHGLDGEALRWPPHYIGLRSIIDKFQVDLTLDPDTAHPNILVSADRKSAVFSPKGTERRHGLAPRACGSLEAVLSSQGFAAGRHFWQVDIRGSGVWSVGVCSESFPRNAPTPASPRHGCWQCQGGTGMDPDALRVGVFLDYELGEISFYNLSARSHLCTLQGPFTERLVPYFFVGPSTLLVAMTLVSGDAEAL